MRRVSGPVDMVREPRGQAHTEAQSLCSLRETGSGSPGNSARGGWKARCAVPGIRLVLPGGWHCLHIPEQQRQALGWYVPSPDPFPLGEFIRGLRSSCWRGPVALERKVTKWGAVSPLSDGNKGEDSIER